MSRTIERRQFGRRAVTQHAWIVVEGRPRVPCRIVNLTVIGALLQLEAPKWLPFQFQLMLGGIPDVHHCEIRHAGEAHIGVRFIAPHQYNRAHHRSDGDAWVGDGNRARPRLSTTLGGQAR